jgi:acyl-coenzyme A thioesterase PaaI-like protein
MPSSPSPLALLSELARPSSLRHAWRLMRGLPGGGHLMGQLVGRMAPYTGTIRPEVLALEPGYARVRMQDRRAVRNHLKSVHAIALMNLGEVATGTAMLVGLPDEARAIIVHLGMDYLKKARGPITAECRAPVPTSVEKQEYALTAELTDSSGVRVARAHARWLVGPRGG